ncbi:MAG: hypothetical protein R3Y10_04390 [Ferrimonas sp.]
MLLILITFIFFCGVFWRHWYDFITPAKLLQFQQQESQGTGALIENILTIPVKEVKKKERRMDNAASHTAESMWAQVLVDTQSELAETRNALQKLRRQYIELNNKIESITGRINLHSSQLAKQNVLRLQDSQNSLASTDPLNIVDAMAENSEAHLSLPVRRQRQVGLEDVPEPQWLAAQTEAVLPVATGLYVSTQPHQAQVEILTIKAPFKQGIILAKGKYLLRVSAIGYESLNHWLDIGMDENHYCVEMIPSNSERPRPSDHQGTVFKAPCGW